MTSCCPEGKRQFQLSEVGLIQNGSIFATGFTIAPIEALATGDARSSKITTTSTAATSSYSSPAHNTNDPSCDGLNSAHDDNKKVIRAGVGSGLGVGLPLLAMLAGALFILQRERNANKKLKQRLATMASVDMSGIGQTPILGYSQELSGHHDHELPTGISAQELPNVHSNTQF